MNPAIQGEQHDKRKYIKLTSEGTTIICEPFEVEAIAEGLDEYQTTVVWMSPAEVAALPDFQGW